MTLRVSGAMRNAMLAAGNQSLNRVYIYAGTQPVDPDTPMDEGTELASFYITMSTPENGYTHIVAPVDVVASGTGEAGWARITHYYYATAYQSIDGAVGTPGTPNAEFILNSKLIVAGNTVRLMDLSINFPG